MNLQIRYHTHYNLDLPNAYKLMFVIELSMGKGMSIFLAAGFLLSVRDKCFSLYKVVRYIRYTFFFFSSLLRSGEARLTRIALAIVWLFIFCHAWRLIPTIYEAFYPGDDSLPTWLRHIHGISHSFIVFNSAVNFLLYTLLWIRIMTVHC